MFYLLLSFRFLYFSFLLYFFGSQQQPSPGPSPSSSSSDDAQPSTSTGSEKYDFRCYICGYCSNMRARFSYHMNLHTGTKPFQCKICLQSHNHKICMFTAKPLCPKVSCISLYLQCSTVGATCFDAKNSYLSLQIPKFSSSSSLIFLFFFFYFIQLFITHCVYFLKNIDLFFCFSSCVALNHAPATCNHLS